MRARDEGVRADVDGHPEPVAWRVDEAALEILGSGKGDGVDEDVEPSAEGACDLREDTREVVVGADVALVDAKRLRERLVRLRRVNADGEVRDFEGANLVATLTE